MIARAATLVLLAACSSTPDDTTLFPAGYATTYTQVRPCRASPDHDLDNVTVWTNGSATEPYVMRDNPFPTGSVVLKEEHDVEDATCSGPITQWTVMVKLPGGSSPATDDWHWQRVYADRSINTDNDPRCYSCHAACGVPPDGYLLTCSAPGSGAWEFQGSALRTAPGACARGCSSDRR